MITFETFANALKESVGRRPNAGQQQAVEAAQEQALFVVAGPGTGKTATLTMRMLKLVFVDGVSPRGILATTFTKKAAQELRSRLLSWGYAIQEHLATKRGLSKVDKLWLNRLDINQVRTGTIDSICEELLRDFRDPGTDPPVLADQFVSETLLLRAGLFNASRYEDDDLTLMLAGVQGKVKNNGEAYANFSVPEKLKVLIGITDRRLHDQIDWPAFVKGGGTAQEKKARELVDFAVTDYWAELASRIMVDFTQLEQTVYTRLKAGGMKEFTDELKVVMVDEYQDSNLLQEGLYFELAKRCGGALTVVGDDDQSLYRFRGATVDLFSQFESRYSKVFKTKPKKIFLNENYRSTSTIINFVNAYATLDTDYQKIRVVGKPALVNPKKVGFEFPVLGMFRDNLEELAQDLAKFIQSVTRGSGVKVGGQLIKVDAKQGGDVGDCALLCSSPREYGSSAFGPPKPRLPLLLKQELQALKPVIPVFNPRGEDFSGISVVQRLGGLLLECLDPAANLQPNVKGLSNEIRQTFDVWRNAACTWVHENKKLKPLEDYALSWSDRKPGQAGQQWPKSVSCIDLLYALVHWIPELHDDPEGQVYLEVFTRQLGAAEQVSNFRARVVTDSSNKDLSDKSVAHLLQYYLAPIASGAVQVDEEMIESFPRDRLNLLSIHQSKGLEFPLVIVDVGSDFKASPKFPSGHPANAFKRFPCKPNTPQNLEDLMRPYSPLATLKRAPVDRAFDDLYRHFFVAFSRPQEVLLLVGLNNSKPGIGSVLNVATGYDRNAVNKWWPKLPFKDI
jgi:DNA helicase-2/ATP-dependent DNA helicase PcrA